DGFGTNNDAGERTISFVGVPGGAQLSRVENYRPTGPGPVTGHLLQAGQRFQAVTLAGSGSVQISGVGFVPSFRLDTPDDPRAGDDTLPVSTPDTLRVFIMNQGPQALISVVPMPFEVVANTVYPVSVTVAGGTLTVTIKGTQVFSGTVSGMRPSGSFGFANA